MKLLVYSFCTRGNCPDGAHPQASLTPIDRVLYGTTFGGGAYSKGTVFSIDLATNSEKVLHSFGAKDGANPKASLINVNGTLYGTTQSGGAQGKGTVFSIDPNTGAQAVLYSFCSKRSCSDGANPESNLIYLGGKLYGTTNDGGPPPRNSGVLFEVDIMTGQQRVLHPFSGGKLVDAFKDEGADGGYPLAGLISVAGMLYGTTYAGGSNVPGFFGVGCGTIFSLYPTTGMETVRYAFRNDGTGDAINPAASLMELDGTLYGTTSYGGRGAEGTVFALNPETNSETVLYSFSGLIPGATPLSNLLNVGGTLYGTTSRGGHGSDTCNSVECGAVFAIDPLSGKETTVYDFCTSPTCTDGEAPTAGLILVNGTLYGTTSLGARGVDQIATANMVAEQYSRSLRKLLRLPPGPFGARVCVLG